MTRRYEVLDRELGYDGFFRIVRYRIRHGLHRGGMSEPLQRECFERGHAVAVLPYDAARDEVVLVEQFRVGALDAHRGPWLIEPIAGIVEPGETAVDVARREAEEEAGCVLGADILPITRYLVSPGGTSEQVSLYCARVDARGLDGQVHGLADEGEDILVHVLPFEQALDMVEEGAINNAMGIIALQWLALNRDRLLDLWGAG